MYSYIGVFCSCLGCAFSRFQTKRLKRVFPQVLADQLISYGPCQFPTLGFVVDRVRIIIVIFTCTVHVQQQYMYM